MVRAVATGKILGTHACYVLEDGRRVLGVAAIAQILEAGYSSGGATPAALVLRVARALGALAGLDASFARPPLVAFEIAPGEVSAGIEARAFSSMCVLASQALAERRLGEAGQPVARAARRFLESLALTGVSTTRRAA